MLSPGLVLRYGEQEDPVHPGRPAPHRGDGRKEGNDVQFPQDLDHLHGEFDPLYAVIPQVK